MKSFVYSFEKMMRVDREAFLWPFEKTTEFGGSLLSLSEVIQDKKPFPISL